MHARFWKMANPRLFGRRSGGGREPVGGAPRRWVLFGGGDEQGDGTGVGVGAGDDFDSEQLALAPPEGGEDGSGQRHPLVRQADRKEDIRRHGSDRPAQPVPDRVS